MLKLSISVVIVHAMRINSFHPRRSAAFLLCASALTLSPAFGEVLVNWGGNYVDTTTVFANTTADADHFRSTTISGQGYSTLRGPVIGYNGTVANLTPTSGYVAPEGKSSTFYGGWSSSSGTAPAIAGGASGTESALQSRSVYNNGSGDYIYLSLGLVSPQIRGLFLFDKDDFLNGMNAVDVAFDENSSLSFTGFVGGWRPNLRWVVQDGDTWYISDMTFTSTEPFFNLGGPVSATLNDPNNQLWAAYTPIASDSAGPFMYNAAPEGGYVAHAFTNIQAVGIFFDSYGIEATTDGTFSNIGLQQFVVTGVVAVPEPSTVALGGLALLGFAFRKLRRKA